MVYDISHFRKLDGILGMGCKTDPPKISGTTNGITMKVLQYVGTYKEA